MLGAETGAWDKVFPETDRKPLDISGGKVEYARLFYHTKKFINDYSVMYYKAATDAVKKHFPSMTLIAPNFQAGPMQFAFIGNNNDMNLGALDLFELGRQRAFEGIMAEDWVYGWDAGIGRISLGADIMRAAARKHNLPMASYLVGGEAIRAKFFAYMMAGIKENQLYLYGPIGNIGPAWADSEKALAETADVTRKVKKMEDDIFAAKVRPAKVAQLIAFTSDIMQAKGLYFCPERQDLYVLLKHNYVPVDIVSEQDITEENILDNYSLLVISDPNIRQDVQKKIAAWVAKGGKLLAFVGAGNWDEYNQPCTILNPVLGVAKRTMVTQENWLQWSAAFYSTAVSKFAYKQVGSVKISPPFCAKDIEFAVWGAKLDCNPVTCKLLGRYEDGKPAVFINRYGKGEAVLAGVLVGQSYVRDHWPTNLKPEEYKFEDGEPEREFISAVLRHMGIKKYVDFSVPGIYTSVMDIPGGMLVFLNNASGRPISGGVLKIHDAPGTKTIDSIVQGPLKYHIEDGTAVLEMPLENVDIVRVISK
jgi:beta-galactosidase GanA